MTEPSRRIPAEWPEVILVERPEQLDRALEDWHRSGILGVDTESNSFYAYWDRLCLFQVSTRENDYIVDPISLGDDLRSVNDLLTDPEVVKIFHAAEFDLMLIRKDLGVEVRGMFDTQVAMTLLQHQKTGLAALIESTYGMRLSKKEQRSNWGRRPLTDGQIDYARIDTHFLIDLRDQLQEELVEKNLLAAAEGEFRRLEREILPPREPDLDGWRRFKGARNLQPAQAARLRALFRWRERMAQDADLPPFRILGNETLLDLAHQPPKDLPQLAGRKGIGWGKARKVGNDLLSTLASAEGETVEDLKEPPVDAKERKRRRVARENREALRKWRKERAVELGLPSERLMHRRHLEEIGRRLPRNAQDLNATIELNEWQRENLESSLLAVLEVLPDPDET